MITKCLHWRSVHKSLKVTLCNRWEASCAILTMKPAKTFPEIDAVCKYKTGSSLSVGWNSSSSKVIQKNTFLKFWQAILRAFVEKKGFTLQFWVHSCVSKFRRYWLQPGSLLGSLFRIGVGGLSLRSLHSAFWNRVDHNIEGKFEK